MFMPGDRFFATLRMTKNERMSEISERLRRLFQITMVTTSEEKIFDKITPKPLDKYRQGSLQYIKIYRDNTR